MKWKLLSVVWALVLAMTAPTWAMEHYIDTVRHRLGYALPGVSITVYVSGTQTKATLYSDNGVTVKQNPFPSNDDGSFEFYAANGSYDLRFSRSGTSFQTPNSIFNHVILFDQADAAIYSTIKDETTVLPQRGILAFEGAGILCADGVTQTTCTVSGGGGGGGGTIAGTTGAVDNAVLRADGAGGATIQSSASSIDDSGNYTTPGLYLSKGNPFFDMLCVTEPPSPRNLDEIRLYLDCSTGNVASIAYGSVTYQQYLTMQMLAAGMSTFLATPTSANLAATMTDETGTGGGFVRATGPTLTSPVFSTKMNWPRVTALPSSPSTGDTVVVTDDSTIGACDSAAGSARTLCQWNGSAWQSIGDGGAGIIGTVGTTDNAIVRANGTGGNTAQGSGSTLDDFGNVVTGGSYQSTGAPYFDILCMSSPTASTILDEVRGYFDCSTGLFSSIAYGASTPQQYAALPLPFYRNLPAGGCNAGTAGPSWNLKSSGAMGTACIGTGSVRGVLTAPSGSTTEAQYDFQWPKDLTGQLDADVIYTGSTASTNNISIRLSTACVADGEDLLSPTFNTASTVSSAGPATIGLQKTAVFNNLNISNCAAGETAHIKLERVTGDAYGGTAQFLAVRLKERRGMN